MESDRAFGIYVAVLVGALLSVVTSSVMAGITTVPTFLTLVEHVAMSLLFRGAYKSLDGPYFVLDSLREARAARTATAPATGSMAGAAS